MKSSLTLAGLGTHARASMRALNRLTLGALLLAGGLAAISAQAQTALADRPLFATVDVPGNLVLALSVEFPTAVTAADRSTTYVTSTKYLGYFNPNTCYTYVYNETENGVFNGSYFKPMTKNAANNFSCSNNWSGNFLNWATMQAIDPFRWALTGGYRSIDNATTTILEKAIAPSGQGTPGNNFPHKSLTSNQTSVTPFSTNLYMQVLNCGNRLLFRRTSTAYTNDGACPTATVWNGDVANTSSTTVYSLEVRVRVCANTALKEDNLCTQYGVNYKPEGLIQKYAQKIRYSAFGYLTDPPDGSAVKLRDGGVLRARMKFVGPTQPVPGSTPIANVVRPGQTTSAEWSDTTGVFYPNPDSDDAAASSETNSVVGKSGVINYLNQFGLSALAYKRYDNVSELYYAATRYLRGLANVPEYTDLSNYNGPTNTSTLANRTRMKDGFPVISNWTDPILYSCQKNFVLGIGDTNTHADKNLPGNTIYRNAEPAMPQAVQNDPINVITATNKVGLIEGLSPSTIGSTNGYTGVDNSAYIAGMAYLFNTTDIRSDLVDKQTISTYWLDVLEGSDYKGGNPRNQFYLAAKYGGFTNTDQTDTFYNTRTTALDLASWSTNGETIPIPSTPGGGPRPDNYFVANQADKMVAGLTSAFLAIARNVEPFTTSFSSSLPQVASSGNSSFSTKYEPKNWTGEVAASELTFDATGTPTVVSPEKWLFTAKLATQIAGTGWRDNRRVVTWNGTQGGGGGVAFRATGTSKINPSDLLLLDPTYTAAADASDYLNYLRGDRTNEYTATNSKPYRARAKLVGDIVGSKARPVGPPSFPYSDSTNPGYAAFKSTYATRRTVVYVGSNDGMLHAINGALVTSQTTPVPPALPLEQDAGAGTELFAYVPKALFAGATGTTPSVDGLASLGNPTFSHHFMVNATPTVYDIDFSRTANPSGVLPTNPTAPDWRSVLIGGLGKGGKAYYAIDVTNPAPTTGAVPNIATTVPDETTVASKVLWEVNKDTTGSAANQPVGGALGYTYGEPIVAKTRKYGWVVIIPSGYNTGDGKGYFLFINPRTGALLEKISTGAGSVTNDAGLAHANAFIVDSSDGTADAVYAGDLLGNLWRLDVTAASGFYPAPVAIAQFRDPSATPLPQPVTSRPSIEVHPSTKKRFVMVGTGRLLDDTDIASPQQQTFYAIVDGTNPAFNPTGSPLAFPFTRAVLANDANALLGVNFDPNTQAGWYEDLGTNISGFPERVTTDSTTLSGTVAFAATSTNGQVCTPSGDSRIYGRNYATAKTTVRDYDAQNVLQNVLYVPRSGAVTDLRFLSVNGKGVLISGTDTGAVGKVEITPPGNLSLRRLNWRELQVVD